LTSWTKLVKRKSTGGRSDGKRLKSNPWAALSSFSSHLGEILVLSDIHMAMGRTLVAGTATSGTFAFHIERFI
jgi:hypothetical protein